VDVVITLFPDGSIQFFYGDDITASTDWSSGVSNGDGSSFLISSIAGSVNIPSDYATQVSSEPFPMGMAISQDGTFYGTPTELDKSWDITFKVTDYTRISNQKTLVFSTELVSVNDFVITDDQYVNISPNPFNTYLDFSVLGKSGYYQIQLSDASGRFVQTVFNGYIESGKNIRFHANGSLKLKPGVYFLSWTNNFQTGSEKIVFIK